MRQALLLHTICLTALTAVAALPSANAAVERHNFPISIANPAPADAIRNGPLFKTIDQLAYSTSKSAMSDDFSPDADIHIHPKNLDLRTPTERQTFLRILLHDCQGPYAIDEGAQWVQTSFVCHVQQDRLIRSYFAFNDSPEISLEFTFENGKISKVFAADLLPLPLPGKSKYLPMNAAETIADKR